MNQSNFTNQNVFQKRPEMQGNNPKPGALLFRLNFELGKNMIFETIIQVMLSF